LSIILTYYNGANDVKTGTVKSFMKRRRKYEVREKTFKHSAAEPQLKQI